MTYNAQERVCNLLFIIEFQANDDDVVDWRPTYRFTSLYTVQDIQPATLHELLEEFKEFANEKFQRYYDAVYTNTIVDGYEPCGCDCKTSHLCAIEHVNYDAFDKCYDDGDISCDASKLQVFTALVFAVILAGKTLF